VHTTSESDCPGMSQVPLYRLLMYIVCSNSLRNHLGCNLPLLTVCAASSARPYPYILDVREVS